jgi:hypothetical protein
MTVPSVCAHYVHITLGTHITFGTYKKRYRTFCIKTLGTILTLGTMILAGQNHYYLIILVWLKKIITLYIYFGG